MLLECGRLIRDINGGSGSTVVFGEYSDSAEEQDQKDRHEDNDKEEGR